MPLYGRSFTLASTSNAGLFAPDRGAGGQKGTYTMEAGFLSYTEVSIQYTLYHFNGIIILI